MRLGGSAWDFFPPETMRSLEPLGPEEEEEKSSSGRGAPSATFVPARERMQRLPDAVAARCLSFLASRSHSRCARTCVWFRRLARMPIGFPELVRVRNTRRLWAEATPALAQMRPSTALHVTISRYAAADAPAIEGEERAGTAINGRLARLLRGQSRVRHLRLAHGSPTTFRLDMRAELDDSSPVVGASVTAEMATTTATTAITPLGDDAKPRDRGAWELTACERLDLRFYPENGGSYDILTRVPNLRRLECTWFDELNVKLLGASVPHLTALRIDRNSGSIAVGFVQKLLDALPTLRSLVLPYARLGSLQLTNVSRRLEALEVDIIGSSEFVLPSLRHLNATMHVNAAPYVLAQLSTVRAGRIGFVHLDGTSACLQVSFGCDDGYDSNGQRSSPTGDGSARWTHVDSHPHSQTRVQKFASSLHAILTALAKLDVVDHEVDASVPEVIRTAIHEFSHHRRASASVASPRSLPLS